MTSLGSLPNSIRSWPLPPPPIILFIIAPGLSAPSERTVRPLGSITVPTVSTDSSIDCISRPPTDTRIFRTTLTLTIALCHFLTISRPAARSSWASMGAARMPAAITAASAPRAPRLIVRRLPARICLSELRTFVTV